MKKNISKIRKMPLSTLFKKVIKRSLKKSEDAFNRYYDVRFSHMLKFPKQNSRLLSYLDIKNLDISKLDKNVVKYLIEMYLNHYFDLLGSGWTKVNYDIDAIGVEGYKYDMSPHIKHVDKQGNHLKENLLKSYSDEVEKIINYIDADYEFIDWQIDFKSGYRWSEKKWYRDQKIGHKLGSDIKVPWELSRMQHLPQLAIFSLVLPEYRTNIIREFKNQILDFIVFNPIKMGCNWTCTMDVGIRVSNMLLAYDILNQLDDENILDDNFNKIFIDSIYNHGRHIISNLEWSPEFSSNHYLADICGLLFVSAYLEATSETKAWLAFSVQELINEVDNQFYDDGGNFEASTSYHRLSGELTIYSTTLIYGILSTSKKSDLTSYNYELVNRLLPINKQKYSLNNDDFFPKKYVEKIFKMGCFTVDISKPNGMIPQIGDNDSGRFFRFSPNGELLLINNVMKKYNNLSKYKFENNEKLFWDENILNHGTFVSSIHGLFDNSIFGQYSELFPLEKSIIKSLVKDKKFHLGCNFYKPTIQYPEIPELKFSKETKILFGDSQLDIQKTNIISYPYFGLYIFKSDMIYLAVYAGGNGQNGSGGHAHNDRLSFELNVKGQDLYIDAGTYLYTPLPTKRNIFRSIVSHNTISIEKNEPNELVSLFSMTDDTKCFVLGYGQNWIELCAIYKDIYHKRIIEISNNQILIKDMCNKEFEVNLNNHNLYSNGYGKLVNKDFLEV